MDLWVIAALQLSCAEEPRYKSLRDLIKAADKLGLDTEQDLNESIYIGLSMDKIGDAETGGEFKLRTKHLLTKLLSGNIRCDVHCDVWFDG